MPWQVRYKRNIRYIGAPMPWQVRNKRNIGNSGAPAPWQVRYKRNIRYSGAPMPWQVRYKRNKRNKRRWRETLFNPTQSVNDWGSFSALAGCVEVIRAIPFPVRLRLPNFEAERPWFESRSPDPPEQRPKFLLNLEVQGPDQRAVFLVFAFDLRGERRGR